MTVQNPPTLRQLLAFPVYREYLKHSPPMPSTVELRHPFQVWAYNAEVNRWGSRLCSTYREAYLKVAALYREPDYTDIALVSRTILCPLPRQLKRNASFMEAWSYSYDWCKRCRRPTIFHWALTHRALKNAPAITSDEALRCYYCGVRKVFAGEEL